MSKEGSAKAGRPRRQWAGAAGNRRFQQSPIYPGLSGRALRQPSAEVGIDAVLLKLGSGEGGSGIEAK